MAKYPTDEVSKGNLLVKKVPLGRKKLYSEVM